MMKVIEFQSPWIVVYHKIHFGVLPQPVYAGQVTVIIVICKEYILVSSSKGNAMVKTKKIENAQLSLYFTVKM